MNRLNELLERILSDARESEKEILAHAGAQADEILADAAQRAEKIKADAEAAARKDADARIERARASCEIVRRNRLLDLRSAEVDAAYDAALASLISMDGQTKRAFLTALLKGQIARCLKAEENGREYIEKGELEVCDTWEVLLCAGDRAEHGSALIEACSSIAAEGNKTLVLSEVTPDIPGGLILREGNVEHNLSLLPLLAQVRMQTESRVHAMLFEKA